MWNSSPGCRVSVSQASIHALKTIFFRQCRHDIFPGPPNIPAAHLIYGRNFACTRYACVS